MILSKRVLIVPDKFKGTLSAVSAAESIKKGWMRVRPDDELELLPMSDGGDGFGEVISRLLDCHTITATSLNAAKNPVKVKWWWNSNKRIAVVESAQVIGLAMLPTGKYHPFELDTYGLGLLLKKISRKKPLKTIIGIGGSATNDGGFGMACAIGWRFFDKDSNLINRWTDLFKLSRLAPPASKMNLGNITVAVDVQNLLLGKNGASRIYGPQKGLKPNDIPFAEKCLKRLAQVVSKSINLDFSKVPGSGAAGGLGYGLMTFLGAKPISGFELFSKLSNLEKRIKKTDLVITGEGSLDISTVMGKGVGEVAKLCKKYNKPCIALAGKVSKAKQIDNNFKLTFSLLDLTDLEQAQSSASFWLEKIAEKSAAEFTKYEQQS